MKRVRVTITGLVQGVFFRAKTRNEAIRNDVTGWVKNLTDGRVEAVFEGKPEDVASRQSSKANRKTWTVSSAGAASVRAWPR